MTLGLLHIVLAGALAASAAGIGGFFYGTGVGAAQEQAAQKRADDAARAERDRQPGRRIRPADQRQGNLS